MFSLLLFCCAQTFERITFTQAALESRDASNSKIAIWNILMYSAFSITTFSFSWIALKIGLRNTARIGALLSLVVALGLMIADVCSSSEGTFIITAQAIAPFAGASDSFLATSILAAVVNNAEPKTRGLTFGLTFALVSVAFVLGIDHEGILSSLGFMETSDESSFIFVCFLSIAISLFALLLSSMIKFEGDPTAFDVLKGNNSNSWQWWRSLRAIGVFWHCFIVLGFALVMSYIKKKFTIELESSYSWSSDEMMNVELWGTLGFVLASPFAGLLCNLLGSLYIVTCGSFFLAFSLLVFALMVDSMQGEFTTTAFVTVCYGISATPNVVVTLIGLQENLEVTLGMRRGTATASLYISSWIIGTLAGLLLYYQFHTLDFKEMTLQCFGFELVQGLVAVALTHLDILKEFGDKWYGKTMAGEVNMKKPYVIKTDW